MSYLHIYSDSIFSHSSRLSVLVNVSNSLILEFFKKIYIQLLCKQHLQIDIEMSVRISQKGRGGEVEQPLKSSLLNTCLTKIYFRYFAAFTVS